MNAETIIRTEFADNPKVQTALDNFLRAQAEYREMLQEALREHTRSVCETKAAQNPISQTTGD